MRANLLENHRPQLLLGLDVVLVILRRRKERGPVPPSLGAGEQVVHDDSAPPVSQKSPRW
jgi:hypothetical protein